MGVDSSTQSTKVEVRRIDDGALVASGRASHPPTSPPRSEQDPNAWWEALVEAMTQIPADLRAAVTGISIAAQQHGLVIADETLAPLRAAKLWNDTESAAQAAALVEARGAEWWANEVGLVPVASITVTKLMWLARHEPERLRAARRCGLPHDWLTARLTGRWTTDRGDASGSGWWSAKHGRRVPDSLAEVDVEPYAGWDNVLPEVLGPTEAAGELTKEAAAALGLRVSITVGPGTGDNMAAALGLGVRAGDVVISLGTSGTVYARASTATSDVTGVVAGFADATGQHLPLVCTLNATKVTDWVAALQGVTADELARRALEAPRGSNGAVCVPYFDGERTPDRPDATATIAGLRTSTTVADVARAAHEGVVCGLLDGLDALTAAGVRTDGRRLLIGGGARSAAFRQITADVSAAAIVVPSVDDAEAVALGAAVQAAATTSSTDLDVVSGRWSATHPSASVTPTAMDGSEVRDRFRQAAGVH